MTRVDFGTRRATTSSMSRCPATRLLPGRYRVHIDVFDYTGSRLLDSDAVEFAVRSPGWLTVPVST